MAPPTTWYARIRRQILHGGVWSEKHHRSNLDGVVDLFRRSTKSRQRAIAAGIAALLADGNINARTGGVLLLEEVAGVLGAHRISRLVEANLDKLEGVDPDRNYRNFFGDDLASPIYRLLGDMRDRDAAPLLRDAWSRDRKVDVSLAMVDPDYVLEHPELLHRKAIGGVLARLPDHARRAKLLTALAPWDPEVAEAKWWKKIPGDVEALKALL